MQKDKLQGDRAHADVAEWPCRCASFCFVRKMSVINRLDKKEKSGNHAGVAGPCVNRVQKEGGALLVDDFELSQMSTL